MNLPNISLSPLSRGNSSWLKKTFLLLLTFILASISSAFLTGFISALSSNIQVSGVTGQIAFDPLITIAYIILFHYLAHFAGLPKPVAFKIFLLTLFLSFTTNFIPGSLFLLSFIYLTKKLLISSPAE